MARTMASYSLFAVVWLSLVFSFMPVIITANLDKSPQNFTKSSPQSSPMRVFTDKWCDCLTAKYSWRDNAVLVFESSRGKDSPMIVSSVSLLWKGKKSPVLLSVLHLPADSIYHYGLYVNGISDIVTAAAHNMTVALSKLKLPGDLDELVEVYDASLQKLHQQTVGWPFRHGRAAIFYHSSIAHAAQRLLQGVPSQEACPPHDAYTLGIRKEGLFVCRQEYEEAFRRAAGELKSSSLRGLTAGLMSGRRKYGVNFEDLVEDIARTIACGSFDCNAPGCSNFQYDLGWHIRGSDTGCCGDYPECCGFASPFCFFHDIICSCCSYFICPEPYCKPNPGCPNATVV